MWTRFMDMHSGGGTKLVINGQKKQLIFIEAPEDQAKAVFYARFGHNPERVSCTCCGEDYSIQSEDTFVQASAWDRGCEYVESIELRNEGRYIERGQPIPEGFQPSRFSAPVAREYRTVTEFLQDPEIFVIPADSITVDERNASVPQQGYVWVGE